MSVQAGGEDDGDVVGYHLFYHLFYTQLLLNKALAAVAGSGKGLKMMVMMMLLLLLLLLLMMMMLFFCRRRWCRNAGSGGVAGW